MQEVGRAMAHADLGRHADSRQDIGLKCCRVDFIGLRRLVKREVDQRRSHIFHGGETLVERACRQETPQQVLGMGSPVR